MNIPHLIGRDRPLFDADVAHARGGAQRRGDSGCPHLRRKDYSRNSL